MDHSTFQDILLGEDNLERQLQDNSFGSDFYSWEATPPTFGHASAPDCGPGQICDQPCDPSETVPCATFDATPCFDPSCSPRCELDGVDTSCNQDHNGLGLQQSPQGYGYMPTSINHGMDTTGNMASTQYLPNINRSLNTAPYQGFEMPSNALKQRSNQYPDCGHEGHAGTGCVNPRLVMSAPRDSTGYTMEELDNRRGGGVQCLPGSSIAIHLKKRPFSFLREAPLLDPVERQFADELSHQVESKFSHIGSGIFRRFTGSEYQPSGTQPFQPLLAQYDLANPSPFFPSESYENAEPMIRAPSPSCRWVIKESGVVCNMHFNSVTELQGHVEYTHLSRPRATGSTPREPIVCCWESCEHAESGKSFRQSQHLKDHIRTHTQHKPYECEYQIDEYGTKCGKEFGEKKALDSHQRTHTKEKPFRCEECDHTFAHQSTLSNHMSKHASGAKKYRCIECGHGDNDRANLSRHYDTHFPKRYQCKLCSKTFSKKANAIRHLKNRSCKNLPQHLTEADLKGSIKCAPREAGELDFSLFEVKNQDSNAFTPSPEIEATPMVS